MIYIEYIKIVINDFKTPILYLIQAVFISATFLVVVLFFYKLINIKINYKYINSKRKMVSLMLFISYGFVVAQTAFFSREAGSRKKISLLLFETWGDTFRMHSYFIENIIMFIPLGIFLPILFYKMRRCQYCVFTGFLCSGTIEIAQFISQRGFLQVDDIFTNTIGTLIGWMTWRVWRRIRKK